MNKTTLKTIRENFEYWYDNIKKDNNFISHLRTPILAWILRMPKSDSYTDIDIYCLSNRTIFVAIFDCLDRQVNNLNFDKKYVINILLWYYGFNDKTKKSH